MLFLFFLLLFNLFHFAGFIFVESQNIGQVPVVDVHLFTLLFDISTFNKFYVDFGALFEAIVLKGPAGDDTECDFSAFEGYDEAFWGLTYFFLQVLKELSGIGGLLDVNSLCFSLENAILVYEDEAHLW